jgi:FtsZ-binding cell division protein ZapB
MPSKYEELSKRLDTAIEEIERLNTAYRDLQDKFYEVKEDNELLRKDNKQLRKDNKQLRKDNKQFRKDNEQLRKDNEQLRKDNEQLRKDNEQLRKDNELLHERLKKVEDSLARITLRDLVKRFRDWVVKHFAPLIPVRSTAKSRYWEKKDRFDDLVDRIIEDFLAKGDVYTLAKKFKARESFVPMLEWARLSKQSEHDKLAHWVEDVLSGETKNHTVEDVQELVNKLTPTSKVPVSGMLSVLQESLPEQTSPYSSPVASTSAKRKRN